MAVVFENLEDGMTIDEVMEQFPALAIPTVRHLRETPPEERSLQLSVPQPANSTAEHLEMSPDGKGIAYVSNETGAYEVYVPPFPAGRGCGKCRWTKAASRAGARMGSNSITCDY